MMRLTIGTLLLGLSLAACAPATDAKDKPAVTLNGVWTLATVQGAPASAVGFSGTMTVADLSAFSRSTTIPGLGTSTEAGTVALASDLTYTFSTTGSGAYNNDYTMSADGHTLTAVSATSGLYLLIGPHTYHK